MILDRIACAWRVLFGAHLLVIEVGMKQHKPLRTVDQGLNKVTLWGTIYEKDVQVAVLNRLSESLQKEIDQSTTRTQGTVPGDKIYKADPSGDA